MVVGSSGVYFGGSGEKSSLVELFGAYGGSEIVSDIAIRDENKDGKLEGYLLG